MSRDPLVISGGNAIIYAASVILDLRKRAIMDSDPITRDEGIKISVTVKKNHCVPDRNPYLKTEYYAIFGQGIEQYLSTLDVAVKQGVLVQAGSYIRDVDDQGNPKMSGDVKLQWQGKEKFRQFVIDNPDYFEQLKARIRGEIVQLSVEEIDEVKSEEIAIAKSAVKTLTKKTKKAALQ